MRIQKLIAKRRLRRKMSIRHKVFGTPERLRLTVTRTLKHISAQLINDVDGKTLVAASSNDKELRARLNDTMKKTEVSKLVGQTLAERAKKLSLTKVSFDRNGYIYTGRVKALADGAREGGLEF